MSPSLRRTCGARGLPPCPKIACRPDSVQGRSEYCGRTGSPAWVLAREMDRISGCRGRCSSAEGKRRRRTVARPRQHVRRTHAGIGRAGVSSRVPFQTGAAHDGRAVLLLGIALVAAAIAERKASFAVTAAPALDDDVSRRLREIYAAIGDTVDEDLSHFPALVIAGNGMIGMYLDFAGGRGQMGSRMTL